MPEYVYSIVLVVIIVVVMAWWVTKKKKEEWKGTLEKKKFNPGDEDTNTSYSLIFRTDEGRKKRFSSPSSEYYDSWSIGDRCEKKNGEFFPVKV